MGIISSKEDEDEEGLPARYARGCASSEFGAPWKAADSHRNRANASPTVRSENASGTSHTTVMYTSKLKQLDPSVRLLAEPVKMYNSPPRLQSIGVESRKKSYFQQLIEIRLKNGEEVYKTPHERGRKSRESVQDKIQPKVVNYIGCEGDSPKVTTRYNSVIDKTVFSSTPSKKPFQKSTNASFSTRSACMSDSNFVGSAFDPSLQIRSSDASIVPFDEAKARFETSKDKEKPKKREPYLQLEELGLGRWNDDQWVPTKVMTPAITGLLACKGDYLSPIGRSRQNFTNISRYSTCSKTR